MERGNFVFELKHSADERVTHLQPVNYKYLRWDQIHKYIIPISFDFSDKSIDDAQEIMHKFFENNLLCRAIIDCNHNVHIKRMVEYPIKVYECMPEEFDQIVYKMGERMLEREVYNEILFDCCFFKNGNELVFFGLFNHLITDGKFNKKSLYSDCFDYYGFESYLQSISGNELVDFAEYISQKKVLIDKYLSSEMNYYHFSICDTKRMVKRGCTFEELWTLAIVDFLRKNINDLNLLPINITSGGRKYNDVQIEAFGDFHEDFIFVIGEEDKFLSEFRYYRDIPYLNAKQYDYFLDTYEGTNYSQYIEPITISVKWNSGDYSTFQTVRKQLPPHAKNAVLGFNLLIEKNLKKVNIDIRASTKIEYLLENFEEHFYECYKNVAARG